MKKIIVCIIVFILIILVGILVYLKLNNYKTEKEIYELAQNLNNYSNFHVHTIRTSNVYGITEQDWYWKDNEFMQKNNEGFAYSNSNEKIFISIPAVIYNSNEPKVIHVYENYEEAVRNVTNKADNFMSIFFVDDENNYKNNFDYKFCGIESINGKECYKIFIKHKLQENEATLWIEKETGFVIKNELNFDGELATCENTYKIGTVTTDDIKKPDLQEFKESGEYEFLYRVYKENGECEVIEEDKEGNRVSYIEK